MPLDNPEQNTSSDFVHTLAEQINQLLSEVELRLSDNTPDDAQQKLNELNNHLQAWCEGSTPPSADELTAIQAHINTILSNANSQKDDSFKALLKHKKTNKAISAYKST
jgi:ElaB/YqjD/DUF883 family membrane-anchored ribosome-binding protein